MKLTQQTQFGSTIHETTPHVACMLLVDTASRIDARLANELGNELRRLFKAIASDSLLQDRIIFGIGDIAYVGSTARPRPARNVRIPLIRQGRKELSAQALEACFKLLEEAQAPWAASHYPIRASRLIVLSSQAPAILETIDTLVESTTMPEGGGIAIECLTLDTVAYDAYAKKLVAHNPWLQIASEKNSLPSLFDWLVDHLRVAAAVNERELQYAR